jgi:hypothetical protein
VEVFDIFCDFRYYVRILGEFEVTETNQDAALSLFRLLEQLRAVPVEQQTSRC